MDAAVGRRNGGRDGTQMEFRTQDGRRREETGTVGNSLHVNSGEPRTPEEYFAVQGPASSPVQVLAEARQTDFRPSLTRARLAFGEPIRIP